jgi:hypothetical protein
MKEHAATDQAKCEVHFDHVAYENNLLGAVVKLRKQLLTSSYLSVCPNGTTRLPVKGFLRNLLFEYI